MRACLNCGQDNPGGFRFCGACGSPLVDMPRHPAGEERKVVTVLFCDLVGFTARSDRADPEDVGAILGRLEGRRRFEDARTMLAALNAEPLLTEIDAALGAATRLGNCMTPGAEEEPA